jgi:hypothetical protein
MLHTLADSPGQYILSFRDCLYCAGMHPAEPICFTIVGTLEAVLKWGTGRDFAVHEVKCSARGDDQLVQAVPRGARHPDGDDVVAPEHDTGGRFREQVVEERQPRGMRAELRDAVAAVPLVTGDEKIHPEVGRGP